MTEFLNYKIIEGMNLDNPISICGTDCSKCGLFQNGGCKGCNASCGMGGHSTDGKECSTYICCRRKNCFHNCGQCKKLPCKLIYSTKDPCVSDENFKKYLNESIKRLKNREVDE